MLWEQWSLPQETPVPNPGSKLQPGGSYRVGKTYTSGPPLFSWLHPDLFIFPGAELMRFAGFSPISFPLFLLQFLNPALLNRSSQGFPRKGRPCCSQLPDQLVHGAQEIFIQGHLYGFHRALSINSYLCSYYKPHRQAVQDSSRRSEKAVVSLSDQTYPGKNGRRVLF